MAFIQEPRRIPLLLRIGVMISERMTGKRMEAARLLSWYPKAAYGAGMLEALVAHEDKGVSRRLLQLIRLQVSLTAFCTFCIDMNGAGFDRAGITDEEIRALQGHKDLEDVSTFEERERVALRYAQGLTETPIRVDPMLVEAMKAYYNERQFSIIVSTIGQVNFWTRTIQGFGIPPAGFSDRCDFLSGEVTHSG